MVNRIVGSMYIIDSSSVTSPLPYGIVSSTTSLWSAATTKNTAKMNVSAVIIMAQTTASRLVVALGNTTNVVLDYTIITGATGGYTDQRTIVDHFGFGVPWQNVFIPVCTACTATFVLE